MTSYSPKYIEKMMKKEKVTYLNPAYTVADRRSIVYAGLMYAQEMGIANEQTLLSCAIYWWYEEDMLL